MRLPVLPLAASLALLAAPALAQAPGAAATPEPAAPSVNAPASTQAPGTAAAPSANAPTYARTPGVTGTRPQAAAPAENPPSNMQVSLDTQRRLKQSLEQNGFEDVTVMPRSYIIHARAPDGSRIVMLVGPDQMRGVVMGTGSSSQPNGSTQSGSSTPEQGGTNR
jgi:hypothetical protein